LFCSLITSLSHKVVFEALSVYEVPPIAGFVIVITDPEGIATVEVIIASTTHALSTSEVFV